MNYTTQFVGGRLRRQCAGRGVDEEDEIEVIDDWGIGGIALSLE